MHPSEGKDAFPPPSQSLKATKFLANPLPMIAVTQTAIMGVVFATFVAQNTPPPCTRFYYFRWGPLQTS